MFPIGDGLAAARQAQGLSLAEVENLTSIRAAQLEALEEERFDVFPGRAYARAFLRSYANALDLDADLFVDEFESRFVEPEALAPPVRRFRRDPPWRAIGAAAFVAAVVGYVAWTGFSSSGSQGPATTPAASAPTTTGSTASRPPPHRKRAAEKKPVAAARVPGKLVIRAVRGPCWIEARAGGPAGRVLYEATLRQGQSVQFGAPRVWLRFGAPWNVEATRGGKPIGGLSGSQALDRIA